MRTPKKQPDTKKEVSSTPPREERTPAFETPSQRRNRDGKGRGKAGSDGTQQDGRGSNH